MTSFDRARETDDGTIEAVITWALNRSREHQIKQLRAVINFIKAADDVSTFLDEENWGDSTEEVADSLARFRKARTKLTKAWATEQ